MENKDEGGKISRVNLKTDSTSSKCSIVQVLRKLSKSEVETLRNFQLKKPEQKKNHIRKGDTVVEVKFQKVENPLQFILEQNGLNENLEYQIPVRLVKVQKGQRQNHLTPKDSLSHKIIIRNSSGLQQNQFMNLHSHAEYPSTSMNRMEGQNSIESTLKASTQKSPSFSIRSANSFKIQTQKTQSSPQINTSLQDLGELQQNQFMNLGSLPDNPATSMDRRERQNSMESTAEKLARKPPLFSIRSPNSVKIQTQKSQSSPRINTSLQEQGELQQNQFMNLHSHAEYPSTSMNRMEGRNSIESTLKTSTWKPPPFSIRRPNSVKIQTQTGKTQSSPQIKTYLQGKNDKKLKSKISVKKDLFEDKTKYLNEKKKCPSSISELKTILNQGKTLEDVINIGRKSLENRKNHYFDKTIRHLNTRAEQLQLKQEQKAKITEKTVKRFEDLSKKKAIPQYLLKLKTGSDTYLKKAKCCLLCSFCGKSANKYCCYFKYYCSYECQLSDWPSHCNDCIQHKMVADDPYLSLNPHHRKILENDEEEASSPTIRNPKSPQIFDDLMESDDLNCEASILSTEKPQKMQNSCHVTPESDDLNCEASILSTEKPQKIQNSCDVTPQIFDDSMKSDVPNGESGGFMAIILY